jgi:hypothetical protein
MSGHSKSLVGSVFERKPGPSAPAPPVPQANGSKTGFPTAQHRSKSVFARNREARQQPATPLSREAVPPVVQQASRTNDLLPSEELDADNWRMQMSEENERRVASMTEEEREQERRDIEERFGKNVGDVLRRARMARESHGKQKIVAGSLEGDLAQSQPEDNGGIAIPSTSPGSFQFKYYMCGTDTPKAMRIVPTGTPSYFLCLLNA